MNYIIKTARPSQAELLTEIALQSKAHWGYCQQFMAMCRKELCITQANLQSKDFVCRVCESDGQELGFYAITALCETRAELDALFVLPQAMGQGVGRALLEHALVFAKHAGWQSLQVQSDPNAEAFYLAFGAKLVGRRESGSMPGRFLPLLCYQL